MIYPRFIKKGDIIGVPAPSNGANDELKVKRFKNACKNLENLVEFRPSLIGGINV